MAAPTSLELYLVVCAVILAALGWGAWRCSWALKVKRMRERRYAHVRSAIARAHAGMSHFDVPASDAVDRVRPQWQIDR